jgi:hypothetical protein
VKIRPRNEPKRRELSRVLAHYSRGPCGARLRRRAGPALAVVGWWQVPWSSAMRMARLWRGRSADEKRKRKRHRRSPLHAGARTATRTRTRSSIPSPPMPAVATQPDSQSNKDGAEKRQLHRSYLVHTHAHARYHARTQVNTHARTYTHTDSACVERAHTGATSMINLPQPLLCFETTRR